jgi:hypothetical protein
MKPFLLFLFFTCAFCFSALGQDKDTLFVKGQAPLLGKLKKIQYGMLTFNADYIGDIEIDDYRVWL